MKLEEYAEQVVSGLPCSKWEKRDVKDELLDHLQSMKRELVEEGYEEQEAVSLTIQRFGKTGAIRRQLSEAMPLIDKYYQRGIMALFWVYIAVISYYLLLSPDRWSNRDFMAEWKERMLSYGIPEYSQPFINAKPFQTLSEYILHYDRFNLDILIFNLFGNVILFIPLGLLVPFLFFKFHNIHRVFCLALAVSLMIETLQLLFLLGSFDVDDLLLNVLGGLIGYGMFRIGAAIIHWRRKSIHFDDDLPAITK